MSTSLANERRIRQRLQQKQQQGSAASVSHVQFQPGLYHYDDDDESQDEDDRESVNEEPAAETNQTSASKPTVSLKALEEQYNRDETKQNRKPSTRPTVAKMAVTVTTSTNGLVAVPTTCAEYTKRYHPKSKTDTAHAALFLQHALRAYKDCASDWAPGWSWQEACLAADELTKGKHSIQKFVQEQRNATRTEYLQKVLGQEAADRLVQIWQLETEAVAARRAQNDPGDDDLPGPGPIESDPVDDEEGELRLTREETETETVENPSHKKRRVIDDEEDEELEFTTSTEKQIPANTSKETTKRRVLDDEDSEEELEFTTTSTGTANQGAANQPTIGSTKETPKRQVLEHDDDDSEEELELTDKPSTPPAEPVSPEPHDTPSTNDVTLPNTPDSSAQPFVSQTLVSTAIVPAS